MQDPLSDALPTGVVENKRPLTGGAGVALMTEIRGASNAKEKRELGWTLRYPSWRQDFRAAYGSAEASSGASGAGRASLSFQGSPR